MKSAQLVGETHGYDWITPVAAFICFTDKAILDSGMKVRRSAKDLRSAEPHHEMITFAV